MKKRNNLDYTGLQILPTFRLKDVIGKVTVSSDTSEDMIRVLRAHNLTPHTMRTK